jgi:predicted dinucleotide-binding enzyme
LIIEATPAIETGTLAELWVRSGHEVMISSRHPEQLKSLADKLGPKAHVGTPAEAAAFGPVALISVPYAATPQVGRDYANAISYVALHDESNRTGEKIGIPIAADDTDTLNVASGLVRDAGFDPVVVGDLAQAKRFDVGTDVYVKLMTAKELKAALSLP